MARDLIRSNDKRRPPFLLRSPFSIKTNTKPQLKKLLIYHSKDHPNSYKENSLISIMEKDIGKIKKNDTTDIVIRMDDFGGRTGLTIREFVNSSETGYTGFTKSGTRIPAESIDQFKAMISEVSSADFTVDAPAPEKPQEAPAEKEEDSGIDEAGLM